MNGRVQGQQSHGYGRIVGHGSEHGRVLGHGSEHGRVLGHASEHGRVLGQVQVLQQRLEQHQDKHSPLWTDSSRPIHQASPNNQILSIP